VPEVFLLAYADLTRDGHPVSSRATARALRRVGADVVLLTHCPPAAALRVRREARYWTQVGHEILTSAGPVGVAVLSRGNVALRTTPGNRDLVCDLAVDGRAAALAAVGEAHTETYRLLLDLGQDTPIVVAGRIAEDLDALATVDAIGRAGFVDTHPPRIDRTEEHEPRPAGILVSGLRVYGDGVYTDPSGPSVLWARLGY